MAVVEGTTPVANRQGLHARPAADIVRLANTFRADIRIGKDGTWVNAKSIMGVMTLAAERGSTIVIRADGDDAKQAVAALVAICGQEWEEFSDE